MSAVLSESIYAAKMAHNDQLIAMATAGSNAARDELRRRLPALMDDVLKMYLAAYSNKKQVEANMAALADIKRPAGVDGSTDDKPMAQPPRGKLPYESCPWWASIPFEQRRSALQSKPPNTEV